MKEIVKYKDLFWELVIKDIKMRHKQTAFGVLWVVFQPLISAIIFTVIFSTIIKVPQTGLAYPIFVFIALNYWNFFSNSLSAATNSLVANEALIKKVYFPRIILPLAAISTNILDFFISTSFLIIISLFFKSFPNPLFFVVLIISLILLLIFLVGVSTFLSALNVRYRDVRQVIPFVIQILIFLTPVFYPLTIVSSKNQWILALNPLTPVIEISRNAFVGEWHIDIVKVLVSVLISLLFFFYGIYFFRKTEKYFADII